MSATTIMAPKRKSARCLFGRPDPEETFQVTRHLDAGLSRIYSEDSRRWNFDFIGEVPMNRPDGDYQFEPISAADVPNFYREKTIRTWKVTKRRDSSPVSDTVPEPSEQLFVVESPVKKEPIASTSRACDVYEKPVTRASAAKKTGDQQDMLKQTKLTNYMPVRKRRSETCLIGAIPSLNRSVSIDSSIGSEKEKRGIKAANNKGAPKRPLRFVSSNISNTKVQASVSDTAIVSSPRSPPAKKLPMSTRRARRAGAGDC